MLHALGSAAPDPIIRLMQDFAADPRADKVDLGVGMYRDGEGRTPVMAAVRAAEARLLAAQETKGYLGLAGDPAFHAGMRDLLLGTAAAAERVAAAGTPGGTGALRQALELVRRANPGARVWLSAPTWPNHPALVRAAGLAPATYRYYDAASGGIDRAGMRADLEGAALGDVVLLHGCCHNPTGADLMPGDWADLAVMCERRGAVPLIDMAYLGFAEGIDADAAGLRLMAASLPEVLIAASGSKSFGLYRERVGCVLAICESAPVRDAAAAMLATLNRESYAFPPDHGARVVTTILADAALRADWAAELEAMRARLARLRQGLAEALRDAAGSDRFGSLAAQRGMFSLIGADPDQVERLRATHGLYLIGDGRINLAGLREADIPRVARAIAAELA